MYREMVQFLSQGQVTEFLCVGGLMSHYVGDAGQPLDVSMLHHGHPDQPQEQPVHSKYETEMVDRFAVDLLAKTNHLLENQVSTSDLRGGEQAARSVVVLMRDSLAALKPEEIIQAFDESSGV